MSKSPLTDPALKAMLARNAARQQQQQPHAAQPNSQFAPSQQAPSQQAPSQQAQVQQPTDQFAASAGSSMGASVQAGSSSTFRILPITLAVATVALGLRGVEMYTNLSIGAQPVQAAPVIAAAEDEKKDDKKKDDKKNADKDAQKDAQKDARDQLPDSYSSNNLADQIPTFEELRLVDQIRQRSRALDERERKLDLQANLLATTEKRIEDKIADLEKLEASIRGYLAKFDAEENKQLAGVVEIFSKMQPKSAAPLFEKLEPEIQLALATRMQAKKVGEIMAKMNPVNAATLAAALATKSKPPSLEDLSR